MTGIHCQQPTCNVGRRYLIRVMRKPDFVYAKSKTQISCAVTARLISAFAFAPQIVQFLFYLYQTFQDSNFLLRLYMSVCVRPERKPEDRFSRVESQSLSDARRYNVQKSIPKSNCYKNIVTSVRYILP